MRLSTIHKIVCDYYGIELDVLLSRTRKRQIIEKRQMFHYLCRIFTNKSLSCIGLYYKDVINTFYDHATVRHSCKTIEDLMEVDKVLRLDYMSLSESIKSENIVFKISLSKEKEVLILSILHSKTFKSLNENLKTRQKHIESMLT